MSGVHGHVLGHLVRRGVDAAQSHFAGYSPEYIEQLQHDAELYEKAGPAGELTPFHVLPIFLTALITFLVMASVKYTVGEVVASLTMIESPTSTAIVEEKPPPYADEPDAPLEKEEPLMPAEAEADVEVTMIPNKPITSRITTTMRCVTRIGGFRAKWRGAGLSGLYHFLHSLLTSFLGRLLGLGLFGNALVYVFSSVALARIHMAWTHAMIAYPSSKPFWHRMVPRKQCKALLLPSFVFAVAQQATILLPVAVAFAVGIPSLDPERIMESARHHGCGKAAAWAGLRLLTVPATMLLVAFAILLPATVTLTRIEALLLPETEDTIVPFDRQAITGDIDLTARGSSRALFVQAWRSFDRASRWRLIKLYVKLAAIQFFTAFVGVHLVAAEVFLIGGEKLGVLIKSAAAQIQLAAIEAEQQAN